MTHFVAMTKTASANTFYTTTKYKLVNDYNNNYIETPAHSTNTSTEAEYSY
jgi:hypothetical protein